MLHHVMFRCSIQSLPYVCGKMRKAWCTQSTKEKEGSRDNPLVPSSSQWDSTTRCRQSMRACGVHERLFAHLDDTWLVSKPERVGDLHNSAERELWDRARIRIHSGKSHVWNRSGRKPPACDELQRRAEMLDEEARVWTGSEIPSIQQGHPSGSRGFRAFAVGGHHRETPCIVSSDPERARHLALRHEQTANSAVLRPDVVEQFCQDPRCESVAMPMRHFEDPCRATFTRKLPHCHCH